MPYYVAPKPRNALLQVFLVSGTKGSMSITYFLGRMTQIQPNGDSKKMAKTPSFGQRGIGAASMMIGLACVMGLPNTASTATSGAWDIHVHTVVKKPSRSELGDLNTRIHIHYRYHSGIPPHRFFVAVASPQQTFPQTIAEYSEFGIAIADIYEVCPQQFTLVAGEDDTISSGSLTLKSNLDFIPARNPGKPFQQLILHDWGNLYGELDGVSLFDFGTSLDQYIMSVGTMFRERRCADVSPEECVAILNKSLRTREPTAEQLERNAHGGQSLTPCAPEAMTTPVSIVGNPDNDFAQVLFVHARKENGGTWTFETTVRHNDQGFDHYADAWQVIEPNGQIIAERVLAHPHDTEQPFTRSQTGINISTGTTTVRVRAKCNVHNFGGQEIIVDLTGNQSEHFEVVR